MATIRWTLVAWLLVAEIIISIKGAAPTSSIPSSDAPVPVQPSKGSAPLRRQSASWTRNASPIKDRDLELEHATWSEGHHNIASVETRLKQLEVPESRVFRLVVIGYAQDGVLQATCDRMLDKQWFANSSIQWATPAMEGGIIERAAIVGADTTNSNESAHANDTVVVNSTTMPIGLLYFTAHAKHEASAMVLLCLPFGTVGQQTTAHPMERKEQHDDEHFLFPMHSSLSTLFRYSSTSTVVVMPLEHDDTTDALQVSNRDIRALLRLHKTLPVLFDLMVYALVVPEDKDGDPILEQDTPALLASVAGSFGGVGQGDKDRRSVPQVSSATLRKGVHAKRMEARVTQQVRRLMGAVVSCVMPHFIYSVGPVPAHEQLHKAAAARRMQKQTAAVSKATSDLHRVASENSATTETSSNTKGKDSSTDLASNNQIPQPWVHSDVDLLAIAVALHAVAAPIPNRRFPNNHGAQFSELDTDGMSHGAVDAPIGPRSTSGSDSAANGGVPAPGGGVLAPVSTTDAAAATAARQLQDYEFVTSRTYHEFHFGHYAKHPEEELELLVMNARRGSVAGAPFQRLFVGDTESNNPSGIEGRRSQQRAHELPRGRPLLPK